MKKDEPKVMSGKSGSRGQKSRIRCEVSTEARGKVEINRELCKGCEYCVSACPCSVLRIGDEINRSGYFYAVVSEPLRCTGCALCAEICPDIAIKVWRKVNRKDK